MSRDIVISDVTVVIPTFKRADKLARALSSVDAQTQKPQKVIVIDDGSPYDAAAQIRETVERFRQSLKISLIVNSANRGANHSRNRGINLADTSYVAFLDSDDMWFPEKLAQQMEAISNAKQQDARPVLSSTGRYRVTGSGQIIAKQFGGHFFNETKIKRSNFIGTLSSVVVETAIAREVSGLDEKLQACQDWDFFIRLSRYVQYVGVAEPLCIYVDHGDDRISNGGRNRVRAHIRLLRLHAGDDIPTKAKIYRVIAEEFQLLDHPHTASRFLAESIACKVFFDRRLSKSLAVIIWLYFTVFPPGPLKEKRYRNYREAFLGSQTTPHQASEVANASALIQTIMGRQ